MENENKPLVERVKAILFSPKTEWVKIDEENTPSAKILVPYLLILAAIPAVFSFIGYGVIGYNVLGFHAASIEYGIKMAIMQYAAMVGGCFLAAFVINELAKNFGATKNFDKAFALVAYSYTAACIGGVFYVYHSFSALASLASLYSLYLLYIGIKPMMKAPEEKASSYFWISLVVMVVVYGVVLAVLGSVIIGRYWSRMYW